MQKTQIEEREYAALLQQVIELQVQFERGVLALNAGVGALDAKAIERAPLPDVRPILAELERILPPATCASQHSGVLLFLRAVRDLRAVKGDLADAARTLRHATGLMEFCGKAMQQVMAARAVVAG